MTVPAPELTRHKVLKMWSPIDPLISFRILGDCFFVRTITTVSYGIQWWCHTGGTWQRADSAERLNTTRTLFSNKSRSGVQTLAAVTVTDRLKITTRHTRFGRYWSTIRSPLWLSAPGTPSLSTEQCLRRSTALWGALVHISHTKWVSGSTNHTHQ